MRWVIALAVGVVATTAGCTGSAAPPEPAPVVTVTITAPPPPTAAAPTAVTPTAGAAGTSWTMPDLVGSNLQDAQNAVQDLTDFEIAVTTSHDSTGAGRQQVLDRNWKVCSQSVAPGTTITKGAKIDFGTVKLDEACR
jgi:PASTA domain-containing protein